MTENKEDTRYYFRGLKFTIEEINALLESIADKVSRGEIKDGISAYEVAVRNGFVGTEEEWLTSLKANDGLSAYEIAVSQGFSGSIEEWVESLKGQDGQKGEAAKIVGVNTTHAVGVNPSVTNAGTQERAVLAFNLPEPTKIVIGDVKTVPYGGMAKVTNVKSPYDVVLSLSIPTGPPGEKGAKGDPWTINGFKNTTGELPPSGSMGEAYLVGTAAPYDIYVYNGSSFVSIGTATDIRSGVYDGGRADSSYGGVSSIDCGRA